MLRFLFDEITGLIGYIPSATTTFSEPVVVFRPRELPPPMYLGDWVALYRVDPDRTIWRLSRDGESWEYMYGNSPPFFNPNHRNRILRDAQRAFIDGNNLIQQYQLPKKE